MTKYLWEAVKGREIYFCSRFKGTVHHIGEVWRVYGWVITWLDLLVFCGGESGMLALVFLGDPVNLTMKMKCHSWLKWTFIFFAKPYRPMLDSVPGSQVLEAQLSY